MFSKIKTSIVLQHFVDVLIILVTWVNGQLIQQGYFSIDAGYGVIRFFAYIVEGKWQKHKSKTCCQYYPIDMTLIGFKKA